MCFTRRILERNISTYFCSIEIVYFAINEYLFIHLITLKEMPGLSREQKRSLRKELEKLFPEQQTARSVVRAAGIPTGNIPFASNATDNWFAIMREAELQEMIPELIESALDRYENSKVLLEAQRILEQYKPEVKPIPREESEPKPLPNDLQGINVQEIQEIIKTLISQDRMEEALKITQKYIHKLAPRRESDVVILFGAYSEMRKSVQRMNLGREAEVVEKNRIRNKLLQIIDQPEADSSFDAKVQELLAHRKKTNEIRPDKNP
ncbi:MAG: effector-associated domain EAD1-containing protein [Bacteroidota bacterium]